MASLHTWEPSNIDPCPTTPRVPSPQSDLQRMLRQSAALVQSTRALLVTTRRHMSRSQSDWEGMYQRVQNSRERLDKNYFFFQDHLVGARCGNESDWPVTPIKQPITATSQQEGKNMADKPGVMQAAAYCQTCYLAVSAPRCLEDERLRRALYEEPALDLVLKRAECCRCARTDLVIYNAAETIFPRPDS